MLRPKTRIMIEIDVINFYLVPKSKDFWYVSFANPSKVLMKNLDKAGECRVRVHRILKRDFMNLNTRVAKFINYIKSAVNHVITRNFSRDFIPEIIHLLLSLQLMKRSLIVLIENVMCFM